MIKIEEVEVCGIEHAIRGMRNPMNSWAKSDSGMCCEMNCSECSLNEVCGHWDTTDFSVGINDFNLMKNLAEGGPVHAKYRRMIVVYLDITAPLYWWKEFDTYKVGTVANSCSTMHMIHAKQFERNDFSHEHLENYSLPKSESNPTGTETHFLVSLDNIIAALNAARENFVALKDKKYWWQMIQLLPSSYNQKRTIMLNYEVLHNIYKWRLGHKLDEWREFCKWIEGLPYSEIITMK